jgi:ATP-binding cassette, subfamily B, bacterial
MREKSEYDSLVQEKRPAANTSSWQAIREFKLLKHYLAPYRFQIFLAFFSLILASSMVLMFGTGLRYLIDQGFIHQSPDQSIIMLLGLLIAVVLLAIGSFGRVYYVSWLGERVATDLRKDVFVHVLTLDISFYEQIRVGELISRLTTDTSLIQILVGTSVAIAIRNILLLTGGLVMMITISAKLSLYCLAVVPIVIVPIILLGRKVRTHSKVSQDRLADIGGYIDECLNQIRTVQAFTHEPIDRLMFRNYSENAFIAAARRSKARALMAAVVMILVFSAISIVLWLGTEEVADHYMSVGDLSAFIFYAVVVAGSAGSFSELLGDLQRAGGAAERLMELLSLRPSLQSSTYSRSLPSHSRGILAMHNVSFAYPSYSDRSVLNKFTLSIAPGENLAIVGPSGAGKSTVFSLLLRFYDPQSGSIYVDGMDIKDVPVQELRERIGVVSQESVLFSTTIYENILYGRPDATEEEVWRAAEVVRIQDFLPTLPHGIHTLVGTRGVRLSGGQKQRIAIARAILRDPSILLLDEATNALDAESEQAVQSGLKHLMATRTTLVIAHRLATVLNADRIVVLDQGEIKAVGTHAELICQDGLYRRLAMLQFADSLALSEFGN